MLTGLIYLLNKAYGDLAAASDAQSKKEAYSFLMSLELSPIKPPFKNFYEAGNFYTVMDQSFFFGKFHGSTSLPSGSLPQFAKWFSLKGSSPVKMKNLFKFYGEIVENFFYPFKKSVQVIPYHGGTCLIINEKKGDQYLVSLYKVKSTGLKRIRTLYAPTSVSEITVSCLRSTFIQKDNQVVIASLNRWVIYDLKRQYLIYQHILPFHQMVCDVVFSEKLNLLFVCYLDSIVVYEWKMPFKGTEVAYTINAERQSPPDIYVNLFIWENFIIIQDNLKITVCEVSKTGSKKVSVVNLVELKQLFAKNLEKDVVVVPEHYCVLITDLEGNLYEVGFENPNVIKSQGKDFQSIVAYNKQNDDLALMHKGELILLRKKETDNKEEKCT